MPKIEVIRKGITPAVRPVPTDTTLAVVPVTLERMGREVETEDEEPVRVDSADDAFRKFKPSIHFETQAGGEASEVVGGLEFCRPKEFSPGDPPKKGPGRRNRHAGCEKSNHL